MKPISRQISKDYTVIETKQNQVYYKNIKITLNMLLLT